MKLETETTALTTYAQRQQIIFEHIRSFCREGKKRAGSTDNYVKMLEAGDHRVMIQLSLPLLLGNEEERELGCKLLTSERVRKLINDCPFTTEYIMAVVHGAGVAMPAELREDLRIRVADNLLHYATLDLRHHGYNDNHVTMASASLILGGEFTDNKKAIEQGRANLFNFRDTLLRRGFIHETNDCYLPHTLYSTAAVGCYAEDAECRDLALKCEARVWADWLCRYHPNLSRKPGPSARDYTLGRLHPMIGVVDLWIALGDQLFTPMFNQDLLHRVVDDDKLFFSFGDGENDRMWRMGHFSRMAFHDYHVPDMLVNSLLSRSYPHTVCGTHETGHMDESVTKLVMDTIVRMEKRSLTDVLPFSGREIFTYQYQEADWAMGTASRRMMGDCPNNNWCINYRKARPLTRTSEQGLLYTTFTINDKRPTGDHRFQMDPDDPDAINDVDMVHWFDNGRYAAMQHERTSILLYRPRIFERHAITSLATSMIYPLCFQNMVDELWLGDQQCENFTGSSEDTCDIIIKDGPLYIGIRPLFSRPQSCHNRIVASRDENWGVIDFYAYQGSALSLEEYELARIGGGFLCEVATEDEFASVADFRKWFSQGTVCDEQSMHMRQVRYQRPGLQMGLRYDVWTDEIMYKMLNGRSMAEPMFSCTGIDNQDLPWLTGDVVDMDHMTWFKTIAERKMSETWAEEGQISS